MASTSIGRQLVVTAVLALAVGFGCSKRAGLDRGDANEAVLNHRDYGSASAEFEEPASPTRESAAPEAQRFARSPSESTARSEKPRNYGAATPAAQAPASPSRSSAGLAAPERAKAAAAPGGDAELQARGSGAYAPSRSNDALRRTEERPGLGTSWGETRKSRVSSVDFRRENHSQPTAVARIFYNDEAGVLAQLGDRSRSSLGANITDVGRGFVSVEIVDSDGHALPGVVSAGRSYVVGRDGERYAIKIRNQEQYRVEVVATVDGLDVIDGTTGNFQKRGYVIDPYSSLVIEGFRKSTNSVASFRFGSVSDSYAARTGGDRHVGVIGVAFFAERGCCAEPYSHREIRLRETAEPFPGQFARPPVPRPSPLIE